LADAVSVSAPRPRTFSWPPAFLERPNTLGPILVAPAILYSRRGHEVAEGDYKRIFEKHGVSNP